MISELLSSLKFYYSYLFIFVCFIYLFIFFNGYNTVRHVTLWCWFNTDHVEVEVWLRFWWFPWDGLAWWCCLLTASVCVSQELEEPDEEDTHRFDSLIPTLVRPPPSLLSSPPASGSSAPFSLSLVPFSLPSCVDTSRPAPAPPAWAPSCGSNVDGGNLGQGSFSNKVIYLVIGSFFMIW